MASGGGWTYNYYFPHKDTATYFARQLYWIRFFDWLITTPLILLCLDVLAGVSGAEIVFTLAIDVSLIITVRSVYETAVNDRHGMERSHMSLIARVR